MVRILLTNDDGIHSDGLTKLEEALRELGDVYVVAPASEMSGASHSLTLSRPLRIRRIDERHWTVDGTPTDCGRRANRLSATTSDRTSSSRAYHGANLGDDATTRGLWRALEATILGVPGLAITSSRARTTTSRRRALAVVAVLKARKGLPDGRS